MTSLKTYIFRHVYFLFIGAMIIYPNNRLKGQSPCYERIVEEAKLLRMDSLIHSTGTGFLINKNGYIITNKHVINNAKTVKVTFFKDNIPVTFSTTVEIVKSDNDIAVLKAETGSTFLTEIPYGFDFSESKIGTPINILGFPSPSILGSEIKLTDGIISSTTGFRSESSLYQISAPIQPGNSGSPIFNIQGNVIGIVVSSVRNMQNVNYGIKSKIIKPVFSIYNLKTGVKRPTAFNNKIKEFSKYICLIEVESKRTYYPQLDYKKANLEIYPNKFIEDKNYRAFGKYFENYLVSPNRDQFESDIYSKLILNTYLLNRQWNFMTLFTKAELLYKIGAYENVIALVEQLDPYNPNASAFNLELFYKWVFVNYIKSKMELAINDKNEKLIILKELESALDFCNNKFDFNDKLDRDTLGDILIELMNVSYDLGKIDKACEYLRMAKGINTSYVIEFELNCK